jgi:hypothetical protein
VKAPDHRLALAVAVQRLGSERRHHLRHRLGRRRRSSWAVIDRRIRRFRSGRLGHLLSRDGLFARFLVAHLGTVGVGLGHRRGLLRCGGRLGTPQQPAALALLVDAGSFNGLVGFLSEGRLHQPCVPHRLSPALLTLRLPIGSRAPALTPVISIAETRHPALLSAKATQQGDARPRSYTLNLKCIAFRNRITYASIITAPDVRSSND